MSLLYHYVPVQVPQPVLPLAGRWVRPRPLINITLIGPKTTVIRRAKLDTGADDTIFPETLATHLGIDLTDAPTGEATGLGSGRVPLRYAVVTMRLASGSELREWRGWVGFTSAPLARSLLGFAGVLQFFTATFYGDREQVELAVNSLYPGT
jgi:hypothetical protein